MFTRSCKIFQDARSYVDSLQNVTFWSMGISIFNVVALLMSCLLVHVKYFRMLDHMSILSKMPRFGPWAVCQWPWKKDEKNWDRLGGLSFIYCFFKKIAFPLCIFTTCFLQIASESTAYRGLVSLVQDVYMPCVQPMYKALMTHLTRYYYWRTCAKLNLNVSAK